MARKNRIGVILSAGGSAFCEAARIAVHLPFEFVVVTDRACDAETRCRDLMIPVERIVEQDNRQFSIKVRDHFRSCDVEFVVLFFSRLVSAELFNAIPCCNVHPSLLPAFPGFSAVRKAWSSGARFLGATAHSVDSTIDGGAIIAQTVAPLPPGIELEWCNRVSFLQKTLLMLIVMDMVDSKRLEVIKGGFQTNSYVDLDLIRSNPSLSNVTLVERFKALQSSHGIQIFP